MLGPAIGFGRISGAGGASLPGASTPVPTKTPFHSSKPGGHETLDRLLRPFSDSWSGVPTSSPTRRPHQPRPHITGRRTPDHSHLLFLSSSFTDLLTSASHSSRVHTLHRHRRHDQPRWLNMGTFLPSAREYNTMISV